MEQNKFLFSETRIPGPVQDTVRVPYTAEWPGPSTRAPHRGLLPGQPVPARRARAGRASVHNGRNRRRDCARCSRPATSRRRAARRVGHLTTKARAEWAASRQALLAARTPTTPPRWTRSRRPCSASAWRTSRPQTRWRPATTCCTATAGTGGSTRRSRSSSSPTAGRHQRRALWTRRHHDPELRRRRCWARRPRSSPASRGPGRRARRRRRPSCSSPTPTCGPTSRRRRRRSPSTRRHRHGRPCRSRTSAPNGPRRWGCRRTRSCRWPTSSPTGVPRGSIGATYESISTRQWRRGRTEAMRVVTPEVLEFVSTMEDSAADPTTRRAAFRAAAQAHVQRAKECQAGRRARAAPVGAAADPAPTRRRARGDRAAGPVHHARLADHARRLPEHQLGAVDDDPVLRLRLDQQPVHRRGVRAAAASGSTST